MITETLVHCCTKCGSSHIVLNGHNRCGSQQYFCNDCTCCRVLQPKTSPYSAEQKEQALRVYQERSSLRGVERALGISRHTVASWIKKKVQSLRPIAETLAPAQPDDVLELDEVWSFVHRRDNKRWTWTALCRRTRQIVAFVIGDRSAETCRRLWNQIPKAYRQCHSFSDFWEAYATVFNEQTHPDAVHRQVGKETGETAHMERWNNTLRQRNGRYVRKTLSFSKKDEWHYMVTKLFIVTYNQSCTI